MSGLPWFRLYAETVDDGKLKLLAFEDRWHFIALCCLKCAGDLDGKKDFRDRLVAAKLGLSLSELDSVRKRLMEVDLVTADMSPKAWSRRQYKSDTSAERTAKWRKNKKSGDGDVTSPKRHRDAPDTDTDTDTDTDNKNTPKKNVFSAKKFLKLHCKNTQVIDDWMVVRKNKKAANTKTAMDRFMTQVEISGMTCEQVLELCCDRSWSGFKAEWVEEKKGTGQKSKDQVRNERNLEVLRNFATGG